MDGKKRNMKKKPTLHAQLKEIATKVKPTAFFDFKAYLEALYQELHVAGAKCNYVLFSQALGLSRSNVVFLIIKGQRPLTEKNAEKIVAALALTGKEKSYFLQLVNYQYHSSSQDKERALAKLTQIKSHTIDDEAVKLQMQFYSEWYHMAIYELTHIDAFNSDVEWIARAIVPAIRPEQARESLALLENIGLIRFDELAGRHLPTQAEFSAAQVIAHLAISQYHHHMIDLAKMALADIAENLRDISAVTIAVNQGNVEALKSEIAQFRKQLLEFASKEDDKDVVYQMNLQLFPISKPMKARKMDNAQ